MMRLLLVVVCLFASCSRQTGHENERRMHHASQILKKHPDSALIYLDSVAVPSLALSQYANSVLLRVQAKDLEAIKNNHRTTLIKYLTSNVILSILLLILVAVVFLMRRKNIRHQRVLEKTEERLAAFQEICHHFIRKENVWQNAFLEKMGIIRDIAVLDKYLKKDKKNDNILILKINEIISKLDLQTFTKAIDELCPGFIHTIETKYPELDEQEISVCCLCYFDFDNDGISILMNKKINTIQQKKTDIRRKIGIPHHGDIKVFLQKSMEEKTTIFNFILLVY